MTVDKADGFFEQKEMDTFETSFEARISEAFWWIKCDRWGKWRDCKDSEACGLTKEMSDEGISKMVKVWGIGLDWKFNFGLIKLVSQKTGHWFKLVMVI